MSAFKSYDIYGGVRLEPMFHTRISYHDRVFMEREEVLEEVEMYNEDLFVLYAFELLQPEMVDDRFSILSNYPSSGSSLEQKRSHPTTQIREVYSHVAEEKRFGLRVIVQEVEIQMEVKKTDEHKMDEDFREEGEEAFEAIEMQWESSFFQRVGHLFSSAFREESSDYIRLRRQYSVLISSEEEHHLGWISLLPGTEGGMTYAYAEKDFREQTSGFAGAELTDYWTSKWAAESQTEQQSNVVLLRAYAKQASDFYTSPQQYKTLINTIEWNATVPFEIKEIFIEKFQARVDRKVYERQENVLDATFMELRQDSDRDLWRGIERDFDSLSYGLMGKDQQVASWERLGDLVIMPPYIDFWFLQELLYWSLWPFFKEIREVRQKTIFLNAYRFWVAKEVDKRVQYIQRRQTFEDLPQIGLFDSHRDYEMELLHRDSFSVQVALMRSFYRDIFLPDQVIYSGDLQTRKYRETVGQVKRRSVELTKDLNILFGSILGILLRRGQGHWEQVAAVDEDRGTLWIHGADGLYAKANDTSSSVGADKHLSFCQGLGL